VAQGASRKFVVNEWLLHNLRGDNGEEAQREAERFLTTLWEQCDRLVVLWGSPWMRKAFALMKIPDEPIRQLSKLLQTLLRDAQECCLFHPDEVPPLPAWGGQVRPDDRYLVRVFCAAGVDVLATSDEPLREALEEHMQVASRDAFLAQYLSPKP
jgi:hypothetical protein